MMWNTFVSGEILFQDSVVTDSGFAFFFNASNKGLLILQILLKVTKTVKLNFRTFLDPKMLGVYRSSRCLAKSIHGPKRQYSTKT